MTTAQNPAAAMSDDLKPCPFCGGDAGDLINYLKSAIRNIKASYKELEAFRKMPVYKLIPYMGDNESYWLAQEDLAYAEESIKELSKKLHKKPKRGKG